MCQTALLTEEEASALASRLRQLLDAGDVDAAFSLVQTQRPISASGAVAALRQIYREALKAPYDGQYYYLPSRCCLALTEAIMAVRTHFGHDPAVRILLSSIRVEPGCKIPRDSITAMAQVFARVWTTA